MVSFGVRDAVQVVVNVDCPFELGVASQRIGSSVEAVVQERLQKSHQRLLQRSARVDGDLRLAEAVVPGAEFVDDVLPKMSRKRQSDIGSKTICGLTETRKIRHAGCFCSKGIDDMRDVRAVTSRQSSSGEQLVIDTYGKIISVLNLVRNLDAVSRKPRLIGKGSRLDDFARYRIYLVFRDYRPSNLAQIAGSHPLREDGGAMDLSGLLP